MLWNRYLLSAEEIVLTPIEMTTCFFFLIVGRAHGRSMMGLALVRRMRLLGQNRHNREESPQERGSRVREGIERGERVLDLAGMVGDSAKSVMTMYTVRWANDELGQMCMKIGVAGWEGGWRGLLLWKGRRDLLVYLVSSCA